MRAGKRNYLFLITAFFLFACQNMLPPSIGKQPKEQRRKNATCQREVAVHIEKKLCGGFCRRDCSLPEGWGEISIIDHPDYPAGWIPYTPSECLERYSDYEDIGTVC